MMLTRCPLCATAFRVTPEQLRVRNGQVRCGHCHGVFNALDFLEEEIEPTAPPTMAPTVAPSPSPTSVPTPAPTVQPASKEVPLPTSGHAALAGQRLASPATDETSSVPDAAQDLADVPPPALPERPTPVVPTGKLTSEIVDIPYVPPVDVYDEKAVSSLDKMLATEHRVSQTLYGVVLFSLLLLLLGQVAYFYRTPLVSESALFEKLFAGLGVNVPLPRQTDLVSIESSDLQADPKRNVLVLSANLKNRANFAQDWPALELTLTDGAEVVLSRRVLTHAEYLPADQTRSLPARAEVPIKLWLSAKQNAAGYRLYVFYP